MSFTRWSLQMCLARGKLLCGRLVTMELVKARLTELLKAWCQIGLSMGGKVPTGATSENGDQRTSIEM
jgi:hypothetical protein